MRLLFSALLLLTAAWAQPAEAKVDLEAIKKRVSRFLEANGIQARFELVPKERLKVSYHVEKRVIDTDMYHIDRRKDRPRYSEIRTVPARDGLLMELNVETSLNQLLTQYMSSGYLGSTQMFLHNTPEGEKVSTSLWFAPSEDKLRPASKSKASGFSPFGNYQPFLVYNIEYGVGVTEDFLKKLIQEIESR